jgi:hypothetical protein
MAECRYPFVIGADRNAHMFLSPAAARTSKAAVSLKPTALPMRRTEERTALREFEENHSIAANRLLRSAPGAFRPAIYFGSDYFPLTGSERHFLILKMWLTMPLLI